MYIVLIVIQLSFFSIRRLLFARTVVHHSSANFQAPHSRKSTLLHPTAQPKHLHGEEAHRPTKNAPSAPSSLWSPCRATRASHRTVLCSPGLNEREQEINNIKLADELRENLTNWGAACRAWVSLSACSSFACYRRTYQRLRFSLGSLSLFGDPVLFGKWRALFERFMVHRVYSSTGVVITDGAF